MVEWENKKLGDIAEIRMCKRIFAEQTTARGDIPFYKIGTFGKEPDAYISRSLYGEYKNNYSFPSKGDILLSAAGTLGRTVVYDGKPAYFQDSNIVWLEIDKDQICNEYLNHCYQVMLWASSEGSTISRLYNGIIRATEIQLPSLSEQRRIAEVLSDTDALIAAVEKLIVKKRAVKQGAMQQLLTGKRRLPGFEGEWEIKQLGVGVLKVGHGKSQREIEISSGKYPILATGGVIGRTDCYLYDKPSVLIGRKGTIDKPQYMDKPFWTIDTLFYTVISKGHSAKYLYYLFCTIEWNKYNEASGVPSLSSKVIEDIEVTIPSEPEQTAIAEILSDMDTEIDALTVRLNKLRNIKQGMMSELLTGRIRLIKEDADYAED